MDIQTQWNPVAGYGDWSVSAGDLTSEAGLRTAVLLSLHTDATAHDDDELLADGDRRGWWGDLALDGEQEGDRFGSRLWLLAREKHTEKTRRRAVLMAREALAWMREDQVAQAIEVDARWQGELLDQLVLGIVIIRPPPLPALRLDVLWQAEGAR